MVKSRSSLIEQKVFVALLKAVNICTITILGIMIATHTVCITHYYIVCH